MKIRDKEALQYILDSRHWMLTEHGDILTRRDEHGRVTDPEVWRQCEFRSTGNRSSTRKRIWVKGRRVYSARAAWVLSRRELPPEGMQVDHIDDDSLNNRPENLQLLDCYGNIQKETRNGKVKWFLPVTETIHISSAPIECDVSIPLEVQEENWYRVEPVDWRINLWNDIKQWPRQFLDWLSGDVMNMIRGRT